MNVLPFPILLFTEMVPLCASTMRLHMDKPKPMPFALVVNSGVHSLAMVFFDMPVPVSAIEICKLPFTVLLASVRAPPSGMASTAF